MNNMHNDLAAAAEIQAWKLAHDYRQDQTLFYQDGLDLVAITPTECAELWEDIALTMAVGF